mgnify:CR=1 FL=1
MYLLDTSYLIDLIRGKPEAIKLAKRIEDEKAYVAISVVTVHEYLLGVFLSYWREEKKLKEMLKRAEAELSRFDILPYTVEIARKTAEILAHLFRKGESLGLSNVIVAATAITYRLKLVTRNARHFSRIPGLEIVTY